MMLRSQHSALCDGPRSRCRVENTLNVLLQQRLAVVVVVAVLTLTRIIKSVVTGQAPATKAEEYPREKQKTTQGGTSI